jgi:hypothetical protein
MKAVKWIVIALVVYVGIVVVFESLIGVLQPEADSTIVITTRGEDGQSSDRVVSRLDSAGQLYVAANHWPRAWYHDALARPEVSITADGETSDRLAVQVGDEEYDRLQREHGHGIVFLFLTGFPPREFLRLDPR